MEKPTEEELAEYGIPPDIMYKSDIFHKKFKINYTNIIASLKH